ncbi:MAG: SDR family oxidoreductase [Caldilineaceae bacterium]|nr:SDR family oxidoreductase [Caldilineaceae bacterium]
MKVLFIGGTGKISSACTPLAVERGYEMYLLNRGQTDRPVPAGVKLLNGDIRNLESARAALADHKFDVVVDWIAYTPDHVETDLALFRNRTSQYIFISSASAYQSPPVNLPVTESTPLDNPYWQYSRDKIACEERLMRAYREEKFPMTIVRPSHTYDKTMLPMQGGWTVIDRMRKGQKVIVHGDGSSLWVLTHHSDFAKGFIGLLGNNRAIGEAFHITSDELITWNQIHEMLARAAGAPPPQIVHVPSDLLNAFDARWGAGLLGDKTNSMIFDNTKIKRISPDFACTIPYERGAQEVISWFDADPARQVVSDEFNQLTDRIIAAYERAWEGL